MKKRNTSAKILVLCLADPSGSPRPRRIAELCSSRGYDVSLMGHPLKQPFSAVSYYFLPVPSSKILKKILRRIWAIAVTLLPSEKARIFCEKQRFGLTKAKQTLGGETFDLLIVENLQLLPLAFEIKDNAKILFDAREYYPRQNEGVLWFELFEKRRRVQLCREYMPRCDAVVTVSEGLRQEYLKEFGVSSQVYRSTPAYVDLPAHSTNQRNIRMVYHGGANRNRRLENLIEIVTLLDDRFSLDLILVGNPSYQRELHQRAAHIGRINFLEPVPFSKIISTISKYDIGFFYYEQTGFNIAHSLPNKFFEYIQARLMIAVGPSQDMANLVKEYGCGIVATDFTVQSMASALNALTVEQIDEHKRNSDQAARELCFEKEREKMIVILNKLLEQTTGVDG